MITLGYQLYSLKGYEDGYPAAFDELNRLGINTIEAWGGAVEDEEQFSLTDFQNALSERNMKLTGGHLTAEAYDTRYAEWRDTLRRFGGTDWVVPFGRFENLQGWLNMLPKFREIEEVVRKDGLTFSYHNHDRELDQYEGKSVFEHLLDNMPSLRAQFHIGQYLPERGVSLPGLIRKYEGRVGSLHVNDANADGQTPIGEGTCEVERCIQTALDTGVDTYIIEVNLTQASVESVKRDIDFTVGCLEL